MSSVTELVRVRANGYEFNTGRRNAEKKKLEVLDESPYDKSGSLKPTTREGGRPVKPRVSKGRSAKKASAPRKPRAAKKAAKSAASVNQKEE